MIHDELIHSLINYQLNNNQKLKCICDRDSINIDIDIPKKESNIISIVRKILIEENKINFNLDNYNYSLIGFIDYGEFHKHNKIIFEDSFDVTMYSFYIQTKKIRKFIDEFNIPFETLNIDNIIQNISYLNDEFDKINKLRTKLFDMIDGIDLEFL